MSKNNKDIQNRSKRIASNTLVLFARMLIITFINLYTVRWVLAGLGTEDYGIFNAVAGVVTASTCVSSILALSTQHTLHHCLRTQSRPAQASKRGQPEMGERARR